MLSRLKGAIAGFGNIAALGHWPTYAKSPDVEIVAVADPSDERRHAAQALKASLRTYATVDDLLSKETLDFIDLCTPPSSHAKLAQQSVQKGIHVLCEKPLALSAADYELLSKQLARSDRTVFTVHNWKYAPIYKTARGLIRQGAIGDVWHVEIFTLRNSHCKGAAQTRSKDAGDWRRNRSAAGGGILIDHGWHSFYLLLGLVDADPQRILAKMQPGADGGGLEEAAQLLVQFPDADGYVYLTWRSPVRHNELIIQGHKGTLLLHDDRLLLTTHDGQREEIHFDTALSAGSHHADWFGPLFADFLAEVRDPARRGQNFREAGWCTALTTAAYDSNNRGFQEVAVAFPGIEKVFAKN